MLGSRRAREGRVPLLQPGELRLQLSKQAALFRGGKVSAVGGGLHKALLRTEHRHVLELRSVLHLCRLRGLQLLAHERELRPHLVGLSHSGLQLGTRLLQRLRRVGAKLL